MQIKERGSLVNPCSFMNTPLVFNRSLYAYGNDIYVHKYDIPEQKWSVIPKTNTVLSRIWDEAGFVRAFETWIVLKLNLIWMNLAPA